MTRQGQPRPARMSAYATASSHLALLSDLALERVVDQAPQVRPGIGGTSATVEAGGVRVFVKQVPVTERELRPGNVRSTANLFGLPGFYQYGLGSAGFGAWRELAAHIMTTNWVLSDEHRAFALLYRGCVRGVRRPGRGGRALGGLGCRTRPPAGPARLARTSGAVPRARPADPGRLDG
jgi:hypothetical protein